VPVTPLHEAHGREEVDVGLHGALVVDLLLDAPDGRVGRITIGFEFEHAGAGFMAGRFGGVGHRHPRGDRAGRHDNEMNPDVHDAISVRFSAW
jgi:hypothetical protein